MKVWLKSSILFCVFVLVSAIPGQDAWVYTQSKITPIQAPVNSVAVIPPLTQHDLDLDKDIECLNLDDQQARIQDAPCSQDSSVLWQSPPGWKVEHAEIGDANWNNIPDVVLLVWRPFSPWPVDKFLVNPGRITNHHNAAGESCHIIIIEMQSSGQFDESWAGSALYRPVTAFRLFDLDGDTFQELIALESQYDASKLSDGSLSVWDWNGFGFTLQDRYSGHFTTLKIGTSDSEDAFILTNTWPIIHN